LTVLAAQDNAGESAYYVAAIRSCCLGGVPLSATPLATPEISPPMIFPFSSPRFCL
jgi:hypothetical protein